MQPLDADETVLIYFLTTPPGVDSEGLIDGSPTPWGNVKLMTQNTLGSISGNTKEAVIVSPLNKFKNSSFYLIDLCCAYSK